MARPMHRLDQTMHRHRLVRTNQPAVVVKWYHSAMDVNVKNLESDVVARLAEQAAAEGMSQQEWLRQVLRRTAARFSPGELMVHRASCSPMTDKEFDLVRKKVAARRKRATEQLGATGRR